MGDCRTHLEKGYVQDMHTYAPRMRGAQVANKWALGKDHDFCGTMLQEAANRHKHFVISRTPAPCGFKAVPHQGMVRALISWISLCDESSEVSGTAQSTPLSTTHYGPTYELQWDVGARDSWTTIYKGADVSFVTKPLPPVEWIRYRVRGVNAISEAGPWSEIMVRRKEVKFTPERRPGSIDPVKWVHDRESKRWVWVEDEAMSPFSKEDCAF